MEIADASRDPAVPSQQHPRDLVLREVVEVELDDLHFDRRERSSQ
jgi:hypothetical protein